MDYISLLPPEIKQKRLEKRRQARLIKMAIFFFGLFLAVYAFLLTSTILVRASLHELREEREALEQQAAALQEYEDLYNRMLTAENRLNNAMGTAPSWSNLLVSFGRATPAGTAWLSDLTLIYGTGGGSLTMRGRAYRYSDVAEMVKRLHELEQLDGIEVRETIETQHGNSTALQFSIEAGLLPGTAYLGEKGETQRHGNGTNPGP